MGKLAGLVLIAAGVGIAANSVSSGSSETSQGVTSSVASESLVRPAPVLPTPLRPGHGTSANLPIVVASAQPVKIPVVVSPLASLQSSSASLDIATSTQRAPRSFSARAPLAAERDQAPDKPVAVNRTVPSLPPTAIKSKSQPDKSQPAKREQQFTSYLSRLLPWRNAPDTPNGNPTTAKAPVITVPVAPSILETVKPLRQLPKGATTLLAATTSPGNANSRQINGSRPASSVVTTLPASATATPPSPSPSVVQTLNSNTQAQFQISRARDEGDDFADARPDDETARIAVARDLQTELHRVGCYNGPIDGTWGAVSQRAMKAFTRRVRATLPVDEPDYILLTLVQGHFNSACTSAVTARATPDARDALDARDAFDADDAFDATDATVADDAASGLPPLPTRVVRASRQIKQLSPRRPGTVARVITPALFKARRLARRNATDNSNVSSNSAPIPTRRPASRANTNNATLAKFSNPTARNVGDMAQQIASRVSNNSAQVTIQHQPTAAAQPKKVDRNTTDFKQPIPANWRTHKWATLPRPKTRSFIQTPSITPGSRTEMAAVVPSPASQGTIRTPQKTRPIEPTPPAINDKDRAAEREAALERRIDAEEAEEAARDKRVTRQRARQRSIAAARAKRRAAKQAARERRKSRRRARSGRYKPKYSLGASNRRSARRSAKSRRKARKRRWRRNVWANQSLNGN